MEDLFESPKKEGYTIYSKSGCPNCIKCKQLLKNENLHIIDSDEYLIENRPEFLGFVKKISNCNEIKSFPIVFYNNIYIGSYAELIKFYERNLIFSDADTNF